MDLILIVAKPYEGEMMRRVLLDAGYQAEVAEGSVESGMWIEQNRPSAVVLSERLLSGSAREFLQTLRMGAHGQGVPVLLVGDAQQLDGLPVNGTLARPPDPVQLISGVRALVVEPAAAPQAVQPPSEPAAATSSAWLVSGAAAAEAAWLASEPATETEAAPLVSEPATETETAPLVSEPATETEAAPLVSEPATETETAQLVSEPTAPMEETLVEAARQRVEAKYAQLSQADYFGLLEVPPMASASELEAAYAQLCASFSGAQLPAEVAQALGPQLDEIREVLDEAYAILCRDELRASYREHL